MEKATMGISARIDRWGLPVCLLVALALRGLVLWLHADELTRDRDAYLVLARRLGDGNGYVDADLRTPTAFRPPLYPLMLAGLMTVLPTAASVAVVNLAWGLVSVWATWRAGGWLGLGWKRAVAALLVAIDPLLLQYSAQPMTEVTCAGLVALLVDWMVRRDRPEPARQFGVGLLFGGLVLCRPTFWPLAGLALGGWIWTRWGEFFAGRDRGPVRDSAISERTRGLPADTSVSGTIPPDGTGVPSYMPAGQGNRSMVRSAPWWIVVGTLLVIAPWVVRNQLSLGWPILTTTHGGYTLLLANNPVFYTEVVERGWGSEWTRHSFDRWQARLQADLADQLGPQASELDRDRWQSARARANIAAEPARFLTAAWYRVRSLWSTTPQGEAAAANPRLVQMVGWYYTILLLAFGVGICRQLGTAPNPENPGEPPGDISSKPPLPQRIPAWWLLFGLVLTVQLVHLAYWTNARMRAPIVPVISLFAAGSLRRRAGHHAP